MQRLNRTPFLVQSQENQVNTDDKGSDNDCSNSVSKELQKSIDHCRAK